MYNAAKPITRKPSESTHPFGDFTTAQLLAIQSSLVVSEPAGPMDAGASLDTYRRGDCGGGRGGGHGQTVAIRVSS
jgi:hypothetical protein